MITQFWTVSIGPQGNKHWKPVHPERLVRVNWRATITNRNGSSLHAVGSTAWMTSWESHRPSDQAGLCPCFERPCRWSLSREEHCCGHGHFEHAQTVHLVWHIQTR
ncbi:MAG: hypothetical protein OXC02_09580 [Rhodobacteraceae bacterium]|nr:hypothetical protein [Paracoccaceae bacterium]